MFMFKCFMLFHSQDEDWYNFRSKVQQVLMQPQATKVYIPNMDKVAREFIDK